MEDFYERKELQKMRKTFNHIMGAPICPACRERLEEKFQEVKKYIRENRTAGIKDVSGSVRD